MNKRKCAVITLGNLPVQVLDIKELTPAEYLELKKKCNENQEVLMKMQKTKDNKIQDLEKQIRVLELTLKLDHGEITKKEFDDLCGLM